MRFINVRRLLSNIQEEVKELPFTVTRYGRPIFIAIDPKEATPVEDDWKERMFEELTPEERGETYGVDDPQ